MKSKIPVAAPILKRCYKSLGFTFYGTEVETFSCKGVYYDEHLMTFVLTANKKSDGGQAVSP